MTALVCDICGGKLFVGADGIAVCESCGTKYDLRYIKEKIQEVAGKLKIDGSVEAEGIESYDKLLKKGKTCLQLNDYGSAKRVFEQVVKSYPYYSEGYEYLIVSISHYFVSDEIGLKSRIIDLSRKMVQVAKDEEKEHYIEFKAEADRYCKHLDLLKEKKHNDELHFHYNVLLANAESNAFDNSIHVKLFGVGGVIEVIAGLCIQGVVLRIIFFCAAIFFFIYTYKGAVGKRKYNIEIERCKKLLYENEQKLESLNKELEE